MGSEREIYARLLLWGPSKHLDVIFEEVEHLHVLELVQGTANEKVASSVLYNLHPYKLFGRTLLS